MSRLCRLKTASHGEDGKWAYEEITKLREQVAAQASEIESLRISYDAACMLVAQMHEAVMGEVVGPQHGVVEDVRNKVAAQAADIRTLEIEFGDVRDSFLLYREKTQAQAAVIEKLREALTACVCAMQDHQAGIGITEIFDKSEELGRKALALPTDNTQILEEVRRAERERAAKVCDAKAAGARYVYQREELIELAAAIRAME